MWIVRLALRRPYTFAVFALLLLIIGPLSILNTPTDIFPNIDIPVVSIVWQYQGLSAVDMASRIVTLTERTLTTTVDNIDHIESQSLVGVAVVKVYFQPKVTIATAIAQITAVSQTQLRQLPAGTTPPLIITYTASSVPILQLGLSGQGLSEQQLNDYGLNFIRTQFATIEGAESPYPYGGKQRQVQVDLNLKALQARGLSPSDVVNAISVQNLILPSGTVKVGGFEYQLATNSAPTTIQGLNDLAHQEREWSHRLYTRRGSCARRVPAANQHCACRWPARQPDERAQERKCLYPRRHLQDQADAADHRAVTAAAIAHNAVSGSIDLCARRH